ncbi:hypothetical protein [Xylanimonas protaetiae]|uniref:Alpha/beta hydrolase n=1 Tax=Xylanimonas protaetiae TaxID=2509457 RepID=A0A4P6F739_9MICO|nr:hypothetical protein [Xylanimonas protaetiae]QAY69047.1 hypothetical protein ET471_02465 [Xylanimonas protaetiae]
MAEHPVERPVEPFAGPRVEVYDGDLSRVAVVLPGTGYSAERPALAFPSLALREAGWSLRTVVWGSRPDAATGRAAYERVVREALADRPDARHLVVGKSLGTFVLPLCAALGVPGAWLTPPLTAVAAAALGADDVPGAVARLAAPAVLVGGTADPFWDRDVAARGGADVVEVPGAVHTLEVPGDWRASLAAAGAVTAAVLALAERITA